MPPGAARPPSHGLHGGRTRPRTTADLRPPCAPRGEVPAGGGGWVRVAGGCGGRRAGAGSMWGAGVVTVCARRGVREARGGWRAAAPRRRLLAAAPSSAKLDASGRALPLPLGHPAAINRDRAGAIAGSGPRPGACSHPPPHDGRLLVLPNLREIAETCKRKYGNARAQAPATGKARTVVAAQTQRANDEAPQSSYLRVESDRMKV